MEMAKLQSVWWYKWGTKTGSNNDKFGGSMSIFRGRSNIMTSIFTFFSNRILVPWTSRFSDIWALRHSVPRHLGPHFVLWWLSIKNVLFIGHLGPRKFGPSFFFWMTKHDVEHLGIRTLRHLGHFSIFIWNEQTLCCVNLGTLSKGLLSTFFSE